MRSLIVGTAGHIDHGKSALVRALTGTDPDRLKEEKERGITIDLGFAHLDLGSGLVASFIDVPGHERFVRNMLAGAHGIDAVVLVVAADESVMPQTREHFHICRLLGIGRGLVALTKCDLADPDLQALAEMEARELVAGSFLEGAPVLRISSRTGEGLDAFREALRGLCREARPARPRGLARLPVDRAFTLRGFGTVVTGTLVSGGLAEGDEVELLPAGRRSRVRGVQVHGEAVPRVEAGHRTALNLAGLEVEDVARGDVVARPGTLRPTAMADVSLTLLAGERPLPDQARVRVHVASAEILARVRVLEGREVRPGATAPAQIRFESPAVVGRGDRLVLRSYSPARTIGGAVALDPLPPRKRRANAATVGRLRALAGADAVGAALAFLDEAGPAGLGLRELACRVTEPAAALSEALSARPEVVTLGREGSALVSRSALDALAAATRAALRRFHAEQPLRAAMPREELRRRIFGRAPEGAFEQVLDQLAGGGEVSLAADAVSLSSHRVRLSPAETEAGRALGEAARAAGLEGVEVVRLAASRGLDPRLLERVGRVLLEEGRVRRVGEALVDAEALRAFAEEVRRRFAPGIRLDVAAIKDLTGLTRKHVIPLLEHLDRERVTRRSGQDRLVLAPEGPA